MGWEIAFTIVLGLIGSLLVVRFVDPAGDEAMKRLAERAGQPATTEVEAWLRPQLIRRTRGGMLGFVWGLALHTLGHYPDDDAWTDIPLYWLSVAVAAGGGAIIGRLVATYTVSRTSSEQRAASVRRRRLGDYFEKPELLQLRLSIPLALVAFAVALILRSEVSTSLSARLILWSGLGTVVVSLAYAVARVLVASPLRSSTPELVPWKEALLAYTLLPLPPQAAMSAVVSAGAVIVGVAASGHNASGVLLTGTLALLMLTAAAVAVVAHALWRNTKANHAHGLPASTGRSIPR